MDTSEILKIVAPIAVTVLTALISKLIMHYNLKISEDRVRSVLEDAINIALPEGDKIISKGKNIAASKISAHSNAVHHVKRALENVPIPTTMTHLTDPDQINSIIRGAVQSRKKSQAR